MLSSLMASCLYQTSLAHLNPTLLTFSVGGRRSQVQLVFLQRLFTSHSSYYKSAVRNLRLCTCSVELHFSSRTHSRTRRRCKNSLFALVMRVSEMAHWSCTFLARTAWVLNPNVCNIVVPRKIKKK